MNRETQSATELQALRALCDESIARELRQQYLLGYTPSRPPVAGSNEWRSITVVVKKPGAQVRARDGYLVK